MKVDPRQIHHRYLTAKWQERLKVTMVQVALLIGFLVLWELASVQKWINPLIFSQPSRIWSLLLEKMADGTLWPHVSVTFLETLAGFLLGTICGTILATMIWWSPFLDKVLEPYLVVLNSMPKVALGPLLIVGLGPGFLSIMAMALAITVIITTIVVYTSFKEVDPNYIKVIKTFGGNKRQVYQKVIFPASFPTIISTLKVNVGLAWVGVIVGEFLVAKQGLGYLIIYGFQVFNFTLVLMSLLMIACLATVMYQGVYYLEKRLLGNRVS
ncbi:NitT/TauT family transport system permease protein [Caldalkalibacillus uzonensis]|uniref:NitT/TauT family transport system permease protein n=1 Tax=Caldalkalibacillus uzonensis TaxID=353224 RepID=A0ABU0CTV3_9BACI|nr:ABC transporter permease [Caldalkalibacillus uzonensis]MDQ0339851.1 NitT/TauT family transport system permease protein [Caldalkalibacillus uzonensis]